MAESVAHVVSKGHVFHVFQHDAAYSFCKIVKGIEIKKQAFNTREAAIDCLLFELSVFLRGF